MIDFTTLSPEALAACIREDLDEVRDHYVPLRADQLRWCPGPAQWSVGQCLHHLVLTDGPYFDPLRRSIDGARERQLLKDGPYRGGRFGRWFTEMVGPEFRRKATAPGRLAPQQATMIAADVPEAFIRNGRYLLGLIDDASGLDLDRARIRSPLLPLLRFRLIDAFRAIVAHDRRHLDQARRVTQTPGFPAGPAAGA